MQDLWKNLSEGKLPSRGCSLCDNGNIKVPKENPDLIGFNYKICDCEIDRESLRRILNLVKYANIPTRYMSSSNIKNWKETSILSFDTLLELVTKKSWLYFHGSPGSGKTFTALIAAQIGLLQEKSVYFTNVVDLLEAMRPDPENPAKALFVRRATRGADILVLDDIGQEKSSQWVREQLFSLINDRWNNMKMTVFTSNFAPEHLKETVSEAVYSRIKGESLEFFLEGVDHRTNY